MKQNRCEGQTSDEAMLVQRATGHDVDTFGKPYGMHLASVHRHIEIA